MNALKLVDISSIQACVLQFEYACTIDLQTVFKCLQQMVKASWDCDNMQMQYVIVCAWSSMPE